MPPNDHETIVFCKGYIGQRFRKQTAGLSNAYEIEALQPAKSARHKLENLHVSSKSTDWKMKQCSNKAAGALEMTILIDFTRRSLTHRAHRMHELTLVGVAVGHQKWY